jgi:hypothetical protein
MSTESFIHQSDINHKNQWVNLQNVANILSVSTATVRNWMKAQKISAESKEGILLFNLDKVLRLKHEIETGASQRLKSRRNKRAVEGNAVPAEYVDSIEYIQITERILGILTRDNLKIDPRKILFEVALCLLFDKKVIHINNSEQTLKDHKGEEPSLTELVIEGKLVLGNLEDILFELWDCKGHHSEGGSYCSTSLERNEYEVLRAVRQLEIQWIRGDDLLGLIYMALSNLSTRKNKGSYYTPNHLVSVLVQKSLDIIKGDGVPKVIDPCCGSGNFLIKFFLVLVDRKKRAGMAPGDAEKAALSLSLHGFDIDSVAVSLAKINLLLLLEASWEKSRNLIALEIPRSLQRNIQCKNALESYEFPFIVPNVGFYDLVIGNPPWGYSFTQEEMDNYRRKFTSIEATMESFSLFIEYALGLLKEGGLLAYVLPEALLHVKMHHSIRKVLLEKTELIEIQLLGQTFSRVFAPTITLLASKVDNQEADHQVKVELGNKIHFVPQKRFSENKMYLINVRATNRDEEILQHMRNLPGSLFLAGQADFALGIVTGNNKEFVQKEQVKGREKVLKGNDIYKYNICPGETYILFEPEKFQQVAPIALYRAPEKLLYRFINENLVFAYDNSQTLSLNSANCVIPRLSGYSMKYIMAILNSRAAQFFYTASFSSVKVLKKHIESIPIPLCDSSTQNYIVRLVDTLINSEETSKRIRLYEQLDRVIMELYALSLEEQEVIRLKFQVTKYLSRG